MTNEEANFIGSMNMCDEISNEAYKKIMCNCEVEEQQPCEEENPNCTECRHYDKEKHYCPRFCRVIEDTMAEITSKQPRWIPCSERLPEREGWYLTSLGDKTYGGADVDMYCKGWVKYGTHVLAWMPLPEPYEESEDEE